jgi:hypothetical protein
MIPLIICQIVITEGWAGVIVVLFLAVIAWTRLIQSQVGDLKSDIRVSNAKEEAINGYIREMKVDIAEIKHDIQQIMKDLAGRH